MAWIRMERKGDYKGKPQYDGICEAATDLSAAASNGYAAFNGSRLPLAAGSAAYCLADDSLHVMKDDGTWAEVGA